ncbi:MAG: LexA family protein [Pseudomonadota bacterium]
MTQSFHDRLAWLRERYRKLGRIPSCRELAQEWGVSSTAVWKVIDRLHEHGYLQKEGNRWLPDENFFARPMAPSYIPAGVPNEQLQDDGNEGFIIDHFLVDNPSRTVLYTVRGDSMIDAGIQDGDVAVLELSSQAREGDIVAAYVDGKLTLKKLARISGEYVLIPCNKMYPVIKPERTLEIYGVLVGLARKYGR